jgi:hypothetical protein
LPLTERTAQLFESNREQVIQCIPINAKGWGIHIECPAAESTCQKCGRLGRTRTGGPQRVEQAKLLQHLASAAA